MRVFLVSLGMLFAASLVGFAVVRWQLGQRSLWPADLPPLPSGLLLSTLILIASSVTMQWALNGIRAGRGERLRSGLLLTMLLGIGFLLMQMRCWLVWLAPISQQWSQADEFRFALTSFYVLTGLHALHVVGGIVPMAIVTRNAFRDAYSADFFPGVQYTAMYWHFLGAVWIILYAALWIGR